MSLSPHRARHGIGLVLLAVVLALSGCGGRLKGPALPDDSAFATGPDATTARAASLTRLGQTALQTGEATTAAGLFEEALLLDSGNLPAALGMGEALLALDRDLEASRAFERALAVQPDSAAAHYGYARAMMALRRPEVAAEHLQALLQAKPGDATALNALGVAYDLQGQHDLAVSTYRQGLAVAPASVPLRNNLGLSLALLGQFEEALDMLRPLGEGPGASRRTRQNLALVYGLQGDIAAAERLGRMDLDGADLRRNLDYIAMVRGLEDRAVKAAALAPLPAAAEQGEPTQPPPVEPQPLVAPLAATRDAGTMARGWFVDLGSFPDATYATERWRMLQNQHPATLVRLARLPGTGEGAQPLLAGPVADETTARAICRQLASATTRCTPVHL
jgi:Flp pilus assembly protein TadD